GVGVAGAEGKQRTRPSINEVLSECSELCLHARATELVLRRVVLGRAVAVHGVEQIGAVRGLLAAAVDEVASGWSDHPSSQTLLGRRVCPGEGLDRSAIGDEGRRRRTGVEAADLLVEPTALVPDLRVMRAPWRCTCAPHGCSRPPPS